MTVGYTAWPRPRDRHHRTCCHARQATRLLAEKRIGAALICAYYRIVGIISERDIVRALAEGEPPR